MFIGAVLVSYLSVQPDSAIERLQMVMTSSPAYRAVVETSINGKGNLKGEIQWQRSQDQIYKLDTFELRQTDEAMIFIDHSAKTYQEYRGFPFGISPDVKVFFKEGLSYPWFLTAFARALDAMKKDWKVGAIGKNSIIKGKWLSDLSLEDVEMEISSRGEIIRVTRRLSVADGGYVIDHRFSTVQAISAFSVPDLNPQAGYVPSGFTTFLTPRTNDQIRSHPLVDPGGKVSQLDSVMGKKGATLLFTSPDCEISAKYAKDLALLKDGVEKAGFPMVEISLGAEKAEGFSGARLFLDKSGNLERRWAIPSTPYLLAIDRENVVNGAWSGWWNGCGDDVLKQLTESVDD